MKTKNERKPKAKSDLILSEASYRSSLRGAKRRQLVKRQSVTPRSAAWSAGTERLARRRVAAWSPGTERSARRSNQGTEIASPPLGARNDRGRVPFHFDLLGKDSHTEARIGMVQTPHGSFETPAFMPVGTQGTVKGLSPKELKEMGVPIVLSNAYHLYTRPGLEVIRGAGGLHRFMGWGGPILTDSGGYQIFSLSKLRKVQESGVIFRSHFDGSEVFLSPEVVVGFQEALGSDIAMVLDECLPFTQDKNAVRKSVRLTEAWARRSKSCHELESQALFGIVQGGVFLDLRRESLEGIVEIGFDGYALGGLSVNEPNEKRTEVLEEIGPLMPRDKARYLMGVGMPLDILEAVSCGIDLFDCVVPTRYGRNGTGFTQKGLVVIRNGKYAEDSGVLDDTCSCYTCLDFTRGYLRHLFNVEEMLGPQLVSLHNICFFLEFTRRIRESIKEGSFSRFRKHFESVFDPSLR